MSNAWSRRRTTIKRPPVCRSKPTPETGVFPATFNVTYSWIQMDVFTFDQNTIDVHGQDWPGDPQTGQYTMTGVNDQGDTWVAILQVGIDPLLCSITFTMTSGHFAGEIITGNCPGWDKTPGWTNGGVLNGTLPNLTGTFDLQGP